MNDRTQVKWILTVFVISTLAVMVAGANDAEHAPSVAEQIAGMQAMCADTAEARAQRQADEALYFRLGSYERIHEFTREIVRLHFENDALDRIMAGADGATLAKRVADFTAAGTGGEAVT